MSRQLSRTAVSLGNLDAAIERWRNERIGGYFMRK